MAGTRGFKKREATSNSAFRNNPNRESWYINRLKKSSSIRFRTEWSPLLIGDIYQNPAFFATFGSFISLALRSCYYVFITFDIRGNRRN